MDCKKGISTTGNDLVVEVVGLCVDFGASRVLDGVTLAVEKGDFLGIIGPNGGGKTTLLKTILGLNRPTSGDVSLFGLPPLQGRKFCGYVPQQTELDRDFPITVKEVVMTGCLENSLVPFHRYPAAQRELTMEMLSKTGIYGLRDRPIKGLSGGEFQKMIIARALVFEPGLLILDEPTASVDTQSRTQIYALLREMNEAMTIILVTHDLAVISSYVRSLACLNREMHYHGLPELNEVIIEEMYGCPVELVAHGVPHRVLKEHRGSD